MYPGQVNSPDFVLNHDIDATETTLVFVDLTGLLAAPNILVLRESNTDISPETIFYSADPVGNTLIVTRGYQGTAKPFLAGAKANRAFTEKDHSLFKANIEDLANVKIQSVPPTGCKKVTNIYINENGEVMIDHED